MKLSLGFSPCPNDTFIFDALVNKKIDTKGYDFDVLLEDVQTLNQWAIEGRLDFSKISYGVLPLVTNEYIVLNSVGALGKGVGPLLISKESLTDDQSVINAKKISIPGINTTAHLLFSLAYPNAHQKEFSIFSEIEQAVISGKTDLGVIIHENRFTYQEKWLKKIIDLGDYWERTTGLPIPLGGIVAKRTIDHQILLDVQALIKESILFAFKQSPALSDYVKLHAQEMSETVMQQHIDLYVNDFSLDLGENGKIAVTKLLEVYGKLNPSRQISQPIFL